jgi:hypothetical protein
MAVKTNQYLLSKSDFMLARECPPKLFYKKKKYPSSDDGNEYLQHLARGGYMVGKLATLLYQGGIQIDAGRNYDSACAQTMEHLKKKDVILFEAAIMSQSKIIRIDILQKKGNKINLIEVKSKSWDSIGDPEKQKKAMMDDYIEDVAYQYLVLKEAYPEFQITPYLFLPDKAKRTKVEGLNLLFRIVESEIDPLTKFRSFKVIFDESRLNEVRKDDLMTLVDVSNEVNDLQPIISAAVDELTDSMKNGLLKIGADLSKKCFSCEYRLTDDSHPNSGYDECWEGYPKPEHNISELYHIGTLGKNQYANELISQKKISLFDISENLLGGKRGERQIIQLQNTKSDTEWFSGTMRSEMNEWEYPLHFIDFETTITALPFHKGMRPYEFVAFQWSCETISTPKAEPVHSEWLNLEPAFPNFKFAESLMKQVGLNGTFLMWATHENTVLRNVYEQMDLYGHNNSALQSWLQQVVKFDKTDSGKFIDMNRFTLENYFHPAMMGKTSIKYTLPAVLQSYKSSRIEKWLKNFEPGISLFKKEKDGTVVNPYDLLPDIGIYEDAERVQDGTGAMRAYEDLMFGLSKGDIQAKNDISRALLLYCKLDTLAMVIIWEHWNVL